MKLTSNYIASMLIHFLFLLFLLIITLGLVVLASYLFLLWFAPNIV
jgi:hypothetical protein